MLGLSHVAKEKKGRGWVYFFYRTRKGGRKNWERFMLERRKRLKGGKEREDSERGRGKGGGGNDGDSLFDGQPGKKGKKRSGGKRGDGDLGWGEGKPKGICRFSFIIS